MGVTAQETSCEVIEVWGLIYCSRTQPNLIEIPAEESSPLSSTGLPAPQHGLGVGRAGGHQELEP